MDIRARTIIAFTPLLALLVGMLIALPLIERRDQQLLEEQQAAADDLFDTQVIGLDLLLEHVAVGQISRAHISPKSERYTGPHTEIARLLAEHAGFAHPSEAFDRQAATIYAELGKRYEEIVGFAQSGNLVTAQQIYTDPRTLDLLDSVLAINAESRMAARAAINDSNQRVETAQHHTFQTIIAALASGILLASGLSWLLISQVVRPIERLTADAEQHAHGTLTGPLSPVGNVGQMRRLRDAFQHLLDSNAARQAAIQQNLDELNERIAREERLRETVQALSVPAVPLQDDMLLLPLLGHLDERRAAELTSGLLESIYRTHARAVVIDITGLAALDADGIHALTQTFDAARLLGCQVFLVGVQSSQALALADGDLSVAGVTVARDIPSVLEITRRMV